MVFSEKFFNIQQAQVKIQCPLWDTSARGARGPVDANILSFVDACNRVKFSLFFTINLSDKMSE